MTIDALRAASAYAQIAKTAGAEKAAAAAPVEKPKFGAMVEAAAQETVAALNAGEQAAAGVAAGDASLVDVVTAISEAEATLETAIAIRNRMIEAYQEIMRMPI